MPSQPFIVCHALSSFTDFAVLRPSLSRSRIIGTVFTQSFRNAESRFTFISHLPEVRRYQSRALSAAVMWWDQLAWGRIDSLRCCRSESFIYWVCESENHQDIYITAKLRRKTQRNTEVCMKQNFPFLKAAMGPWVRKEAWRCSFVLSVLL